ncbi:unnamed protein product [Rotaria magnacalcarata]|uniref:Uncharacterized protein n=1 Tax=Rotaria magnacalcarata TaxID=392030 RepID=A0A820LXG7_9BILA|nr:unnamed protein product [Rotaria magnacalcarata]
MAIEGLHIGNTNPLNLLNEEPRLVIYDPGHLINNPAQNLHPFDSLFIIHSDLERWLLEFVQIRDKQWIIFLILPNFTPDEVVQFVNSHVVNQQRLHSFYLIFNNGVRFNSQFRMRFPGILQWCRSFTHRLYNDIRSVCATVCDLQITFCDQRLNEIEDCIDDHSQSIVNMYNIQKFRLYGLQATYTLAMSLSYE